MKTLALVTVVGAGATAFALRPDVAGTATMWLGLSVPYAVLSAFAVHRMVRDGTLLDVLKPKWGDLSLGLVVAAVLVGVGVAVRRAVAPEDSERYAWIFLVVNQMGGPETVRTSAGLTAALVGIAAAEELVWRGLVLTSAEDEFGTRRAWLVSTLLYAIALSPTLYTLRAAAGPNPLLVLAAVGVGGTWSWLRTRTGRLPPVIVSHVAFSYFAPITLTL